MRCSILLFVAAVAATSTCAFTVPRNNNNFGIVSSTKRHLWNSDNNSDSDNHHKRDRTTQHQHIITSKDQFLQSMEHTFKSTLFAIGITAASWAGATSQLATPQAALAADGAAIATCLFQKCQLPLAKCIANPKCLANVICINTCNGKEDELGCQIKCGDIFENEVVGEFNKCAVSDMSCVPQQKDRGEYPVPVADKVVPKFNTKFFNGRLYITAGQNPLFDIFPCQVHFFTETAPGTFFGKLNWQIEEPDGELFSRDALQRFVQDPDQPGHLLNHDNEFLHYQDDWWIIDYEYDDNKDNVPPFAFVYYRGSNDAWDGYGGVVVYTRDSKLPPELLPRLRTAAAKVGFDYDKDFAATDNSCKIQTKDEQLMLKEKFAGKVALQTEKQVAAQATKVRGNAANNVKAQKLFVTKEFEQAERAFSTLEERTKEFEKEVVKDVVQIEKEVVKDVASVEKDLFGETK